MFASIPSAVLFGARRHRVTVEVHLAKGLPGFHVVRLPDESIRESRDRVRAAVMSAGVPWPETKVRANLAPSQQRNRILAEVSELVIESRERSGSLINA